MKRIYFIGVLFFISLLFAGCLSDSNAMPEKMPADFEFSLSYGIHGKQGVDTAKNRVVKDLVADGIAEADIALSNDEMETIYQQLAEINVMGEVDLEAGEQCFVEPSSQSAWKITANGETAEFEYKDACGLEPRDTRKLRALEKKIHQMVLKKEAYKALPEANGAYE